MSALCRHACIRLLLILHAFATLPAHAAAETPACGLQPAGPSCAAGQPAGMSKGGGVSQEAGNPINLITGNKYQREVDMAPLPGVLGLELVRHYNSHYAAPGMPLSGAGRGWQFSYDTRLYAVGETLQIIQADGTRLVFSRTAWSSTLCSAPDPAHGQVRILKQGRHQQYRWRWPNGRELAFDRNGRLTHIFAPSGEWLGIERDDSGRLRKVSDPQGRSMLFHYPSGKKLKAGIYPGVQSVDTPVGRFLYDYGAPESDSAAREPARRASLTAVHLPTSYDPHKPRAPFALGDTPATSSISTVRRIYHYENPRFPTLLTGITVEGAGSDGRSVRERIATWAYDGNGLAVLSVKGEPVKKGGDGNPLPDTGIEQISIDRGVPGMVRLSNSLGQVTVYRHAIVAGDRRLLEVRGPGCASCGDTDVRYHYDSHGRLQEVTRLDEAGRPREGRRLWLDGLGRIYGISAVGYQQGKAVGRKLVLRQQYAHPGPDHAWSNPRIAQHPYAPVLVARDSAVPAKQRQWRFEYNRHQQPVRLIEHGFNPLDGSEMVRATDYRYQSIRGRSVLVEIDGPLPNGPAASPQDSDITRYEWDPSGSHVVAVTAPGGGRTVLEHDPHTGLVTRMVRDDGESIALRYDTSGRIIQTTTTGPGWQQPLVRSMVFDAHGRQTGSGAGIPGQADWRPELLAAFDAAGRPDWIASAAGIVLQWRHDTESRLQQASISSSRISRSWHYRHDERGRIIEATDPAGASMRFGDGPGGAALTASTSDTATDNVPARVKHVIDDFGRHVASISPDSGKTIRVYDQADRLVASTDAAGNRAAYAYDISGRIQRQDIWPAGQAQPQTTRWHYQGRGLVKLDHPTQQELFLHDERGLLVRRTTLRRGHDGASLGTVTRYEYDSTGRLDSISLPDGSLIHYLRNGQGQVTAVQRSRIRTDWLRWLLPTQVLARDIERDLVGISRYITGNGIEARYQRSKEGVLARIVYRPVDSPPATEGKSAAAHLPGALRLPPDLQALYDDRLLWDVHGNLLHRSTQGRDRQAAASSYAYDRANRLIVAAQPGLASRYFHDAAGNRLLSQQGIASQAELRAGTAASRYQSGSNRWLGDVVEGKASPPYRYDANGQPLDMGDRRYRWDALGRLTAVQRGDGSEVARYVYNHRGERIASIAGISDNSGNDGKNTMGFLYEDGKLHAETDQHGSILRQYLWLGNQPLAVIDTPAGRAPAGEGALMQVMRDLATVLRAWVGSDEQISWLHPDHLGSVALATDAAGVAIWQASYSAHGAATIKASPRAGRNTFTMNLRLPGQYWDAATGLHYNRHRYYDPQSGRYLTPDPLGMPDGPNSYVYVKNNPLRYVDPEGLVLFAFDGTGNAAEPMPGDTISNVRKFWTAYDEDKNGKRYYITGIGTTDEDMPVKGNMANGKGFDERVELGFKFLDGFINKEYVPGKPIDIDVVGFSRGAAEARVWMNQLIEKMTQSRYTSKEGKSACLSLRFMGLWDTVPHLGYFNEDEARYDFSIDASVPYVAHAVALNEHRGGLISFDGVSILLAPATTSGGNRIEMGFIGSHADIGGGYGTGDMSDVALMWMIEQARRQGVAFENEKIKDNGWNVVSSPIIHDKSGNKIDPPNFSPAGDRDIAYGNGTSVKQGKAIVGGNDTAWARSQVNYYSAWCGPSDSPAVGLVDMQKYNDWLVGQGINISYVSPPSTQVCE